MGLLKVRAKLALLFDRGDFDDTRITYSRPSGATVVNAEGLNEDVLADVPRLDYDPVTGELLGLLIEEGRTNLIQSSEKFDGSEWFSSNLDIYTNHGVSPNGRAVSTGIRVDGGVSTHFIASAYDVVSGQAYCNSVYLKSDSHDWVQLSFSLGGFGTQYANFDLINGVTGQNSGLDSFGIEDVGEGWYRCYIVSTATASVSSNQHFIALMDSDSASRIPSYTGNSSDQIQIWGAQGEQGYFPTSYIPTRPTFTSRASTKTYVDSTGTLQTAQVDEEVTDHHVFIDGQWVNAGQLLEEQRTNIFPYSASGFNDWNIASGATFTSNQAVAPNGLQEACQIEVFGSNDRFENSSITVGAGTYSFSYWIKSAGGSFTIRVGDGSTSGSNYTITVTDEWQRISHEGFTVGSFTKTQFRASSDTGAQTFYLWGVQYEEGNFSTSYIPTSGSSVTRSADVYSTATATRSADQVKIEGTAFTDFYNYKEGTFVIEAVIKGGSSQFLLLATTGGANIYANETLGLRLLNGNSVDLFMRANGGADTVVDTSGNSIVPGTFKKYAFSYKESEAKFFVDGSLIDTDTFSDPLPTTVNQLNILTGSNSGIIKRITFYPKQLDDTISQTLTKTLSL